MYLFYIILTDIKLIIIHVDNLLNSQQILVNAYNIETLWLSEPCSFI